MFDTWEDLLEHGTVLDIEIEARDALNRGEDVPFDVVVILTEAGIIL